MARRKRSAAKPRVDSSPSVDPADERPPRRRPLSPQARKALLAAAVGLEAVWLAFLTWMAVGG